MDYLQKLFEWFAGFWESVTNWFQDMFYWAVNTVIALVGQGIQWATSIFPEYTVPVPDFTDNGFLQVLAWVFPVKFAIVLFGVFCSGVVFYLTVGTALRWLKVVR